MSQPPLDAVGKLLMSMVILLYPLNATTLVGTGGYKGKLAKKTPNMGLSMYPAELKALTLILNIFPRFPARFLVMVNALSDG